MFSNFGDFDLEDGAILGGIFGFAEESGKEESRKQDDPLEIEDIEELDDKIVNDDDLRLLRNQDPDFFNHIVAKVVEQRKQYKKELDQKHINRENEEILEEIKDEIKQLRREEKNEE